MNGFGGRGAACFAPAGAAAVLELALVCPGNSPGYPGVSESPGAPVTAGFDTAASGGGSSGPRRPQEASVRARAAMTTVAPGFERDGFTNKFQKCATLDAGHGSRSRFTCPSGGRTKFSPNASGLRKSTGKPQQWASKAAAMG
jgi:hypothetical protein